MVMPNMGMQGMQGMTIPPSPYPPMSAQPMAQYNSPSSPSQNWPLDGNFGNMQNTGIPGFDANAMAQMPQAYGMNA